MILARGNRACAAGTPGVGHTPPEEAPQLVTEMLLKFLAPVYGILCGTFERPVVARSATVDRNRPPTVPW
jgi:hypothetical protein